MSPDRRRQTSARAPGAGEKPVSPPPGTTRHGGNGENPGAPPVNTDLIGRFCGAQRKACPAYEGGAEEAFALQIERQLRNEYGGDRVRINKCELRGTPCATKSAAAGTAAMLTKSPPTWAFTEPPSIEALRYRPLS